MDRRTSQIDHELMRRCREGDFGALTELVDRWDGRVGRVLARLVASPADVDDLRQDVFLRVFRARHRYRARGAFSTWLYRIVLNVARDAARRRRPESLGSHEPRAHDEAAETLAERRELCGQVADALASLPETLREPLVLKHYSELTFAQVAEVSGVPVSTVKSRVGAALARLRGTLQRQGISHEELNR